MKAMLEGKIALVTGAGSGIGKAAAELFAEYGAHVAIADINRATIEAVAAGIERTGGTAVAITADATDTEQVNAMVAATVERFGGLDCAFNNVGVSNPLAPIGDLPVADWDRTIALTMNSTMLCLQAELRHMSVHGGGTIVNTASNAGKHSSAMLGAYGAAKAAVINMTQTAAVEYADKGIRVNAVCPGVIDTPPIAAFAATGVDFGELVQIPMGRIGKPREVAELAAWLCSPLSSFVTGQAISIDGGQIALP